MEHHVISFKITPAFTPNIEEGMTTRPSIKAMEASQTLRLPQAFI